MTPVLTGSGRLALAAAAAFALCGAVLASWTLVAIGCGGILALVWVYLATLPIPRILRKERLELAWWIPHGPSGVVTPGVAIALRCQISNRTSIGFGPARIEVLRSDSLDVADEGRLRVALPVGQRVEIELRVTPRAVGPAFLHGLALTLEGPLGLSRVHVYFPNALSMKVFPRAAASRRASLRPPAGVADSRAGRHLVRRRGAGAEIREIRPHQAGDPFRSIAWKATARTGRLMVRELESEVQAYRHVVLDVSATMRGGEPGRRKIDHAIEVAASYVRIAAEQGDRFGVVTFDTRVVSHTAPAEGRPALLRALDTLIHATSVVDEDLTEAETPDVVIAVAEYVRHQEGLDFRVRDEDGRRIYDIDGLSRHAARSVGREAPGEPRVRASDPLVVLLRRYCRARGIPLPYRGDPAFGQKDRGLLDALRTASRAGGRASSTLLVSDLEALEDWDALYAELRRVVARGQRVLCVVPFAPLFTDAPSDADLPAAERKVHALFAREEERRVRGIEVRLASLGIPVVRISPRDLPALIFSRAALLRAS